MAILDQTGSIDAFMRIPNNREKWEEHIATSKKPLGQIKDVRFSFTNPLVNAHFRFALFVLDVLGEINTIFQAKYSFFQNLWEYVPSLGQFLMRELEKIQRRDFGSFPYLAEVGLDNIPQFVSILKRLIMNLSVRFYNISFSLNKGTIKDFIDYEAMNILRGAPIPDGSRCGLSDLLEVFNMRHTNLPFRLFGVVLLNGIQHEWGPLMSRALDRKDEVFSKSAQRLKSRSQREKTSQLLQIGSSKKLTDVFHVLDKRHFNNTWRFVIRVLTIMPTTVACEQSFSFFKRTIHINMSDQTAKIFLMARKNHFNHDFNL